MKGLERNDPQAARRYFEDKLSFTTGPVEVSKAMKNDSVRVIDVREKKDFDKEHIPGSVHLPEIEWPAALGLTQEKLNVLLCYSDVCHLAAKAAVEFASRGYSVMELEGGFEAWKSHGLPTEKAEGGHEEAIDRTRALLESQRELQRAERSPAKEPVEAKTEEKKPEEKRPEAQPAAEERGAEREEKKAEAQPAANEEEQKADERPKAPPADAKNEEKQPAARPAAPPAEAKKEKKTEGRRPEASGAR